MGKRYHCDYCDKTMVATPAIIKTHNNGVVHQKLVNNHYQQFKDPETILAEEAHKKPCKRFPSGQCQFGSICLYSHYSKEEIESLRHIVATKNYMDTLKPLPSFQDLYLKLQDEKAKCKPDNDTTSLYDSNGITHVLPWTYNCIYDNYGDSLPPSLRRMQMEDFKNIEFNMWG